MIGYNTEAELTAYATERGIDLISGEDVLLTRALDWLELRPFSGVKTDPDQSLEFPRNGEETVPEKIKTAQKVAALIYDQGGDPMAAISPRVTSETVFGAVSVTYSDTGNQTTLYPQLMALLREYLSSVGGNQFEVRRG